MTQEDVAEVSRVERRCFDNPWPSSAYRRELRNPLQNVYIVLRAYPEADTGSRPAGVNGKGAPRMADGSRTLPRLPLLPFGRKGSPEPGEPHIAGFAGMWLLYDEAHITTIGVDPGCRGRGFGELLLTALIDAAIGRGATWLTLEVRVSNTVAQRLYEKYGFTIQGTRRRYYSDNGEDAYIMWSRSLKEADYLAELQTLRAGIRQRLGAMLLPGTLPHRGEDAAAAVHEVHG